MSAPEFETIENRARHMSDLIAALPDDAKAFAARRVLATIRESSRWLPAIGPDGIDWPRVLKWARLRPGGPCNSVRVRYEIAAHLDGFAGAHVRLEYAATVMEYHTYLAVLHALRVPEGASA